ncbi:hypothetical protein ACHAQA_000003 [Verticillium albo-atrum]
MIIAKIFTYACGLLAAASSGYAFTNPIRAPGGADPQVTYSGGWYYLIATEWTDLKLSRARSIEGLKTAERGASPWDSWSYGAQLTNDWGIDGTIVRFNDWGNYFVYSCSLSIISKPDESWERSGVPVQEGQNALYFGGKTYIAYSANYCWTPNYCVATLEWDGRSDPMSPAAWKKSSGCVLSSANGNYGTGHNSFFMSPDGKETWITFHATSNSAGACDNNRNTYVQPLTANSNGTPNFGRVQSNSYQWREPSGTQ